MTANGNPLEALVPRSAGAELPADAQPLTQAEAAQLADGLHALFCAQARALTMGKSGSLPQEAAAELIASMLYTLGVQPDRPESYAALRGADLPALLAQGRDTLERKTAMAKAMAARLCLSAPGFGCIALRDTLSGIVRGLECYDARFFAHRVPGSINYQLLRPVPERIQGVDYILAYLTRLHAELRLLARLPLHRVLALLDGFSPEWRELVANLYAPVAANALGLELLGGDPRRLHIGDAQRAVLLNLLGNCSVTIIEERLFAAARTVCRALDLREEDDTALLLSLALDLAPRVHAACAAGDLSCVFVSFGLPKKRG